MKPTIVFDIETRPNQELIQDEEFLNDLRSTIKVPKNYKDPIKIAAHQTEEAEKTITAMALNFYHGQIAAIGWSVVDDSSVQWVAASAVNTECEKSVLDEFATFCFMMSNTDHIGNDAPILGGFNIREFDIPYVLARCAVHGVELPGWFPRYNMKGYLDGDIMDLREMAKRGKGNLNDYLRMFGLPSKSSSGIESLTMKDSELKIYLEHDVDSSVALLQRMAPIYRQPMERL